MKSSVLLNVDTQLDLPIRANPQVVDMSIIHKQKTLSDTIKLSVQISGFEDKQVYMTLGIDAGHWTRMMNGGAHFPQDKLNPLMDFVGNEIPLIWLANSRGYELKQKRSVVEQERDAERERADKAEHQLEIIKDWMRETK